MMESNSGNDSATTAIDNNDQKKKNNNSNKSATKKKKKTKKVRQSPEEQVRQERQERFEKLLHQARKCLHREAKMVKSFETQKVVRKIKQQQPNDKEQEDQTKLERIKKFSLDALVRTCLQRLGVYHLIPEAGAMAAAATNEAISDDNDEKLLERLLKHKRLVAAMETWNQKVTEFRRWYLRRQDAVNPMPSFGDNSNNNHTSGGESSNKKKKRKKKGTNQRDGVDHDGNHDTGGLFVSLGGAQQEMDYDHQYGPGSEFPDKKKNRPGQRARKAKALAIQARREGRYLPKSLNWREKKEQTHDDERPHESAANLSHNAGGKDKSVGASGKTAWQQDGQAHPSWAARQSQKVGIVEFTGKKITF